MKRRRGYNPAIAKGDMEIMTAFAAALASAAPATPPANNSGHSSESSRYRSVQLFPPDTLDQKAMVCMPTGNLLRIH